MKQEKLFNIPEENEKNNSKTKSLNHNFNLNPDLLEKIKKFKNDIRNKGISFDYMNFKNKITTEKCENSKIDEIPKTNIFSKYNFSNLNNIKRIYLRNNNCLSTEIDHQFFNRKYNNYFIKQNDKYYTNKNININPEIKSLEPIYEVNIPSKLKKVKNANNNCIYQKSKTKKNQIKSRHMSPNQYLSFKNKNYYVDFDLQKYLNYYPYIKKVKKIKVSNSNENILLSKKFNNSEKKKKLTLNNFYNITYRNNSPCIYYSNRNKTSNFLEEQFYFTKGRYNIPLNKINERLFRTTHYKSKEKRKNFKIKEYIDEKMRHKQLSHRKYFGDNYRYFERNESPIKEDNTFHKRRNPFYVFGYENFLILEDSNSKLVEPILKIKNRLNSEGNIRKIELFNCFENS